MKKVLLSRECDRRINIISLSRKGDKRIKKISLLGEGDNIKLYNDP